MILRTSICLFLVAGASLNACADVLTLLPNDIHGGSSATAQFSNANLTLTPFQGATQATFNANATRLGIDDFGTNANAFNDPDVNPNNGNEELLLIAFTGTSGLSSISYDFSRADGPGADDGVIISGFLSNPNVTFTTGFSAVNGGTSFGGTGVAAAEAFWDGTLLRLNIPGGQFNGTQRWINFDPLASSGQTLLMRVTDTTQAGAQLAVLNIAYEMNAVPEPSFMALSCAMLVGLIARRRKSARLV